MKQHTQQRKQSNTFYHSTTTNQPAAHITYSLPSGWCNILYSVFPVCHWRTSIQMSRLKFWLVLHFHMGQSSNTQNTCGIQDKPRNKTAPTVNCLAGKGLGERQDKVNKHTDIIPVYPQNWKQCMHVKVLHPKQRLGTAYNYNRIQWEFSNTKYMKFYTVLETSSHK